MRIAGLALISLSCLMGAEQDVLEHIQEDWRRGKLSQAERLFHQWTALRDANALPEPYRADRRPVTRIATSLKAEALSLLSSATDDERVLLQPLFQRPALPLSLVSPSGRFRIHYTDSGLDAASSEYIQEAAQAFDYAYEVEIGQLGFAPPPPDYGVDGLEYDVYVQQLGDYGATTPEQEVPETPQPDYTGWMTMDNDFTHTPTKGLDAMRVTAAHEFFHLVQFGYRCYHTTEHPSAYFYEATATLMEDLVFPEVNDYFHYLARFFKNPELSFIHFDGSHEYGLAVFFHMLKKKFTTALLPMLWEQMKSADPLEAINNALLPLGSNFNNELGQFAIWNCYTGSRADTVHFYPEGDHYPEVTVSQALDFDTQLTLNGSLASLGCKYLRIHPQTPGNRLVISPAFSDPYQALCAYAYDIRQQHTVEVTAGQVQQSVATVAGMSDLWILPLSLQSPYASAQQLTFQINLNLGEPGALASKIDLVYPNPFFWEPAKEIVFEYQISTAAEEVQMYILTEQGTPVRFESLGPCARGWNTCRWDGRNDHGQPAAAGIYLCLLKTSAWQEYCKFALLR